MAQSFVNVIEGGNILDAEEIVIIHQCNCITRNAHGLAKAIFNKWPQSDCYSGRMIQNLPGTINPKLCGDKIIVNMFSQYYPGNAIKDVDTPKLRLIWFENCLLLVLELLVKYKINRVAMPYLIGCGLAGGNWNDYFKIIKKWANIHNIHVSLYDINEESDKIK